VIRKVFFAQPHSYVRIIPGKLRPDIRQIRQIDLAYAIGKPTSAEVAFNLEEPLDPFSVIRTQIRALSFVPSAEEEIGYPIRGLNFAQCGGIFVDPDESSRRKMYNGSRNSFGNSHSDAVRQHPGNHGTADPCQLPKFFAHLVEIRAPHTGRASESTNYRFHLFRRSL
jgi:hypothetical protein